MDKSGGRIRRLWRSFVMPISPGTVSKILWHFTGGPHWLDTENRQADDPKPEEEAFAALVSILQSKELRVGRYKEVIKVDGPMFKRIEPGAIVFEHTGEAPTTISSAPVTCIADIPIIHLNYHAERYGRIAIGFHREATIRAGFSPVFYQLQNSPILRAIHAGFCSTQDADQTKVGQQIISLMDNIRIMRQKDGLLDNKYMETLSVVNEIGLFTHQVVGQLRASFSTFLAYIKTFNPDQFNSVYCEREWRSTTPFRFQYGDISTIVVPRNIGTGDHYERFIEQAESDGLPRSVSVMAWEDLIEH
jgi:hypothetical protein